LARSPKNLFATGNTQAKAYALVGIRDLDVNRYNNLVAPQHGVTQTVTVQYGCIISHVPFSSIVKQIDAGAYDKKYK